ncbi:hypothetical protein ANTRET_LOCUS4203 [Anthophora retusa]
MKQAILNETSKSSGRLEAASLARPRLPLLASLDFVPRFSRAVFPVQAGCRDSRVVHLGNFRPGRDYGRATINSWLGSRSQTNQPANQPAIQPTRQSGGSVYSTWDKGMLGGDTVAAVQANRQGDEGGKEMGVRLEPCCHNTAAN